MKPLYTTYFLTLAALVSQRSIDPSTKCGALLVSRDRRILSTGYNGPIRGVDDGKVPLTRPEKYPHMLHAEENCILSYFGSAQDLEDATIYVTGRPCHKCLRMILQKGIRNIVVTDSTKTVMQTDPVEMKNWQDIMDYQPIDSVNYQEVNNIRDIHDLLLTTAEYVVEKNPSKFYTQSV